MTPKGRSENYEKALEQFVVLWGEMASAWGINKTMAQIHALLYAEAEPLDADTIMERLDISRGNASMNLRNLIKWDLIHKVHLSGNRKDYYTAEKDVWNIVSKIVEERQKREVAPIRKNLEEVLAVFKKESAATPKEQEFRERIENFVRFLEMFERFTDALLPYIDETNISFLKQLVKLAEMKENIQNRISTSKNNDE